MGGRGGAIYIVFSGGLSEKSQRKRSQNVAVKFFGGLPPKKNFPTSKAVPGAYSDQRDTPGHTWNTPKKCFYLTERGRKRVKEWR